MSDMLDPSAPGGHSRQSSVDRRRTRNPLKTMMQHLSVDPPPEDDDQQRQPRRPSIIRGISWRMGSRSPSAHSDLSSSGLPQDPNLCQTCTTFAADIDTTFFEMDKTFQKPINPGSVDAFDNKEYSVGRLKDLEENRWATQCPLCKLFLSVHVSGEGDGDLYLTGYSSRDTNYLIDTNLLHDQDHPARHNGKGFSLAFMAVVPKKSGGNALSWDVDADWFHESGMLFRTQPEPQTELLSARSDGRRSRGNSVTDPEGWTHRAIWGRELDQTIDMKVGLEWLRFCEFNHQNRCGRREVAEMPSFRLLDCSSTPPRLVNASISERYVALSYVWGTKTTDTWPRVIRDAARVTWEMGVRFLWVDRLCMGDLTEQERMAQICRMDDIFEGAVFAIIAACGSDATHGLPGVGTTSRMPQPKYKFHNSNTTLVSSLRDPRLDIQDSTWYSRGWTYQEGLLARRRLIFTERQMYWECGGMCCPESLVLPLELYHRTDEQRMHDFMRPGLFNRVSFIDGSWERWKALDKIKETTTLGIFRECDQHIVNYSRRNLTYDEDSVKAFLGISRRLETTIGKNRIQSLLGIPVWVYAMPGSTRTRDIFALSTCFWHHREGIVARRRPHLPSWTWAGWNGAVELFSNVTVADPDGKAKERKYNNHHYVTATQVTRNDSKPARWTYSPDIVLVKPDGSVAYDFGVSVAPRGVASKPSELGLHPYGIHVPNPLVLDKVKARTHEGGWIFNRVSVDVKLSRGGGGIREYIERHARGEQMTVLWFIEKALVMLLIVERTERNGRIVWERVGRMRMGFPEPEEAVVSRYERLEKMVQDLPLRRLGEDIVIE